MPRPTPPPRPVVPGEWVKVALSAGFRPLLVTRVQGDPPDQRVSGWLFHCPDEDALDPVLRDRYQKVQLLQPVFLREVFPGTLSGCWHR